MDIETPRSNAQKCYEVSKAITRLLRHDQTVFEEATQQYSAVTSSKSAGRSSMVLRNGHSKIGYQLWQEEEELRKDCNIA